MGYSYRDMPKCETILEGMKVISGDVKNLRVTILEDVCYAVKSGKKLHLRMLRPADVDMEKKKLPVYIHIQGSAWMKQDMNNHVMDFKEIAAAGYLVVIVEYRESAIALLPAQVYDAKDAVRYVADHAEELLADTERMFVSGDSSGGHTCLSCWATWHTGEMEESSLPLPAVRGFIDLYGVVDLVTMDGPPSSINHAAERSPETLALGGIPASIPQRAAEVNVLNYIKKENRNDPLLIMHGNKDRLVPYQQTLQLYEKCRKEEKDIECYVVDDADHGGAAFYCTAVYQTLLDWLSRH